MNNTADSQTRCLVTHIRFLRNAQSSVISGSGDLAAYGLSSHLPECVTVLKAIRVEAHRVAGLLDQHGAHDEAADARQGWALILPPVSRSAPWRRLAGRFLRWLTPIVDPASAGSWREVLRWKP